MHWEFEFETAVSAFMPALLYLAVVATIAHVFRVLACACRNGASSDSAHRP